MGPAGAETLSGNELKFIERPRLKITATNNENNPSFGFIFI